MIIVTEVTVYQPRNQNSHVSTSSCQIFRCVSQQKMFLLGKAKWYRPKINLLDFWCRYPVQAVLDIKRTDWETDMTSILAFNLHIVQRIMCLTKFTESASLFVSAYIRYSVTKKISHYELWSEFESKIILFKTYCWVHIWPVFGSNTVKIYAKIQFLFHLL